MLDAVWHLNLLPLTDLRGLDLQTGFFTYRQIKAATNNFCTSNKLGEGGFGSVYKVYGDSFFKPDVGYIIRWLSSANNIFCF